MPGIAPNLTPAVLGTSYSVTGGPGHTSTSSLTPEGGEASGLDGAQSGPWWIEEQRATITYFRAPIFSDKTTTMRSYNFSLSGSQPGDNNIVSGSVSRTDLYWKCEMETKGFWSDDLYTTSSNIVLQKFEVIPVTTDINGNTYGSLSAGCFGPQGQVVTTQAYHSRTPYASQTSYVSASVGYNYAPYDSRTFDRYEASSTPPHASQEDAVGQYMYFFNRNTPHWNAWPMDTYLWEGGQPHGIKTGRLGPGQVQYGSYDSTLERSTYVPQWIDSVCGFMNSGFNLYNHAYAIDAPFSVYHDDFGKHKLGELYVRGKALPNYSTNRHDFT